MATVQAVLTELKGANGLLTTQSLIEGSDLKYPGLRTSLTNSLSQMIRSISQTVTCDAARTMLESINNTSFTVEQKQALSEAVQAKLIGTFAPETLGAQEFQTFGEKTANVLNYFTQSDMQILADPSTDFDSSIKLTTVVDRFLKGGLFKPSPPTCADVVAMLAALAWNDQIAATRLYECVFTLGKLFKAKKDFATPDLPILKKYPASPTDLPQVVFDSMFSDPMDPPVTSVVDSFFVVRGMTNCRSSGRHVRDHLQAHRRQPQEPESSALAQLSVEDFMAAATQQGLTPHQALQQMTRAPQRGQPAHQAPPHVPLTYHEPHPQHRRGFVQPRASAAPATVGAHAGGNPAVDSQGTSDSQSASQATPTHHAAPLPAQPGPAVAAPGPAVAAQPGPAAAAPLPPATGQPFGAALKEFDAAGKTPEAELADAEEEIKKATAEYEALIKKAQEKGQAEGEGWRCESSGGGRSYQGCRGCSRGRRLRGWGWCAREV